VREKFLEGTNVEEKERTGNINGVKIRMQKDKTV
jgi:hypothetical protein